MSEIYLCRPDSSHYCIKCCTGRGCVNLGSLPDDTRGCLGHHNRVGDRVHTLPQTPFCRSFNCLPPERQGDNRFIQWLKAAVTNLPPSEFSISTFLNERS